MPDFQIVQVAEATIIKAEDVIHDCRNRSCQCEQRTGHVAE